MTYTVSSSRVWVCSGGSSPGRTRHSTTAQSPPDCSPTIFSSALEPWPLVTVRPPPGPVRTGSVRDMCLPFHAAVGQAGRRTRYLRCCWSLYPLATLPVELTLPLLLTRVDTARCEGFVRHPISVSEKLVARRLAALTHFGAEAAVFVAGGVALALLGAREAGRTAGTTVCAGLNQ